MLIFNYWMTRTITFCFVLIFCSISSAQYEEDYLLKYDKNLNSTKWLNEQGIKSIQLTSQKINGGKVSKKIKLGNFYEFNEDGLLIRRSYKDGKHISEYKYNDKGQLVMELVKNKGEVIYLNEITYNESGQIIKSTWNEKVATYVYNDNGNLIEVMITKEKDKDFIRQRFIYDSNGKLKEMQYCRNDGTLKNFIPLTCSWKVLFAYDNKGKIIEEKILGPKPDLVMLAGEEWYLTIVYEYDSNDQLIKKEQIMGSDILQAKYLNYALGTFKFDLTQQKSLHSLYFNEAQYIFPFITETYESKMYYPGEGYILGYKYEDSKLTNITEMFNATTIFRTYSFFYNDELSLEKVEVREKENDSQRLSKKELISLMYTKY